MSFSRPFSAATWLWRRITSRPARLLYLGVLVIVVVSSIALRVEAALFERRVHKVTSALSSLRIGVTPKAEALSRLAGFKINENSRNKSGCNADECLWVGVSSPKLSGWVLREAGWSGRDNLFLVLSWWGFQLRSLEADVNLNSDKVSSLGYQLFLSTPQADYPRDIVINAYSMSSAGRFSGVIGSVTDESPNYQVFHSWRSPAFNTNVYFTQDTTPELLSHAFGLKLQCLWCERMPNCESSAAGRRTGSAEN